MIKVINNDISVELLRKNETSAGFLNDRIDEIIMEQYENESEERLQDVSAHNLELSDMVKELQTRVFEAEKDVSFRPWICL
jgi:HSP90 family molecular chaperone